MVPAFLESRAATAPSCPKARRTAPRPARRIWARLFFCGTCTRASSAANFLLLIGALGVIVGAPREGVLAFRGRTCTWPRPAPRTLPHVPLAVGVPQAIFDHRIAELDLAHAKPGAGALQKVGRVRHRLHAPGHHHLPLAHCQRRWRRPSPRVGPTRKPCSRSQPQPAPAPPPRWPPGAPGAWPRPACSTQPIKTWLTCSTSMRDFAAAQRGWQRGPQLRRAHRRQSAEEGTDGGAGSGEDNGVLHDKLPVICVRVTRRGSGCRRTQAAGSYGASSKYARLDARRTKKYPFARSAWSEKRLTCSLTQRG